MSRTWKSKLQKNCLGDGPIFAPTLKDLRSVISVPVSVSVSATWRPGFGYVLAAVSVTFPVGSRYESGKLVPATVKMAPVTPPFLGVPLITIIVLWVYIGGGAIISENYHIILM